jgi:hypothetical protein
MEEACGKAGREGTTTGQGKATGGEEGKPAEGEEGGMLKYLPPDVLGPCVYASPEDASRVRRDASIS